MADFQQNYLSSLAGGLQIGQQIKQQRDTSQINRLAGLAYGAAPQEQEQLLGQMNAINPQMAQEQEKGMAYSDERRNKTMVNMARMLTGAPEQARAGIYAQMVPTLSRFGMSELPQEYNAQTAPIIDKAAQSIMQALQGAGGDPQQFTLGPGSKRFDAAGNVVAEVPFAPASGNIVEVADGRGGKMQMVWDPRTRQLSDLPQAGGSAAPTYEDGSPMNVTNGAGPDGTPFRFDPNMPAEDRELAMADVANGGSLTSAKLPPRDVTPQQFARGGQLGYTPPKQEEQYGTLTAAEVASLGLPAGTIAQRSPSGQVQIINKPRDLPTGGQVIDNGDGTTTYIPAGKITEGERNASGFYQRMIAANAEMQRLEGSGYDPANRRDYYTAGGEFLNPLASTEGQQYRQAQDNWLRANLRKESGAAIGVAEMDQERKNYFPIPGDSPGVIAQKARNRTTTERAMRAAAGGGLPAAEGVSAPATTQSNAPAPPASDFSNLWN